MQKTNNKILITGGAGFIGSNLVEYFLKKRYSVICLDNLSTGYRKNIDPFLDNPLFTFIEGDIREIETCRKAVKECNYVLHQAALGSVPRSINDPITTNAVNIGGVFKHAYCCKRRKSETFCLCSKLINLWR